VGPGEYGHAPSGRRRPASADETAIIFLPPTSGADETAIIDRVRADDVRTDDTVVLDRVAARPNSDETVLLDRIGSPPTIGPGSGSYGPPEGRHTPRHRRLRDFGVMLRPGASIAGELMITFGLILLLFAAYEVWGKAAIVASHQNDLDAQLEQAWQDPTVSPQPGATQDPGLPPVPGDAIGRLYLPRLGKYWVVVEGVEPADIAYAPGHYPGTAMPGQTGNFSVAGHRSPAIFWDLDLVQKDDMVIVETQTTWYVYQVTQVRIVPPTAVEVVGPTPPGEQAGKPYLTITTCNPKWDNYERLIVHARLDHTQDRSAGRPTELGGM
jgi:sortase A